MVRSFRWNGRKHEWKEALWDKFVTGTRPHIVFECVGLPSLVDQAIGFAGPRERVVVAGVTFTQDFTALGKEVSLIFRQAYAEEDFEAVINAIARHEVTSAPLHSDTISLNDLPVTFEALRTVNPAQSADRPSPVKRLCHTAINYAHNTTAMRQHNRCTQSSNDA